MMWGSGVERFGTDYPVAAAHMGLNGDWMAIGMFLIPVLLLGVIIWLVLRMTGHIEHNTDMTPVPAVLQTASPVDAAVTIVRDRFARGEIDRDEYERLISALRG